MGTRNLTCVVLDGEMKIASYGQWDGYPSGNGFIVRDFTAKMIADETEERFKTAVRASAAVSAERLQEMWMEAGAEKGAQFVSMEVSQRFQDLYPSLSRNTGAGILDLVMNAGDSLPHRLDYRFGFDGLFCEWAYVLDLDNRMLEVYEGFGKEPTPDDSRWPSSKSPSDNDYAPIRKVMEWSFDALPNEDEFLEALEPQDDEYEEAV